MPVTQLKDVSDAYAAFHGSPSRIGQNVLKIFDLHERGNRDMKIRVFNSEHYLRTISKPTSVESVYFVPHITS